MPSSNPICASGDAPAMGSGGAAGDAGHLDNFDPMTKDYLAPSNAYHGLEQKQQPYFRAQQRMINNGEGDDDLEATQPYMLHVANIPASMDKSGISNLFSQYGRIVEINTRNYQAKSSGGQYWANVTFASQMDAQTALDKLNRTEPWRLTVRPAHTDEQLRQLRKERFAKEGGNKEAERLAAEFERTGGVGMIQASEMPTGRGKSLATVAQRFSVPVPKKITTSRNFGQESYSSAAEDMTTNGDSTRSKLGQLTFDPSTLPAKQFGYPLSLPYEIPGSCRLCTREGRLRCSRCKAWYCSQRCQLEDWPENHRTQCEAPPALEHADGTPFRKSTQLLRQPLAQKATQTVKSGLSEGLAEDAEQKISPPEVTPHQAQEAEPTVESSGPEGVAESAEPKEASSQATHGSHPEVTPRQNGQNGTSAVVSSPSENICQKKEATPQEPADQKATQQDVKPSILKDVAEQKASTETTPVEMGCIQSILDFAKPGSQADFYFEWANNADCFKATEMTEMAQEAFGYVLGEMQEFATTDKKTPVQPVADGQFVLYFSTTDSLDTYNRGFVIRTAKDTAQLVNIDFGRVEDSPLNRIFELPDKAKTFPALAIQFKSTSPIKPEMRMLIQTIVAKEWTFTTLFEEVPLEADGRCKCASAAFLGHDKGKLTMYKLYPWTSLSVRIPELLGYGPAKVFVSELPRGKMSSGDNVFMQDFDLVTDLAVVQNVAHLGDIELLEKVLAKELEAELVPEDNPQKGEVVACRSTEFDAYYRAEVTSVDPERKKVKVRFLDYGNRAIEPMTNLARVPALAVTSQFPIFAHVLKLVDVPSLSLRIPEVQVKMNHLKPQLDIRSQLVVRFVDESAEPRLAKLEHKNGKTLNEMLMQKLTETDESAGPGDMQGKAMGGGFEYDRCHVTEIAFITDINQAVVVMHAEDPYNIFVTPCSQVSIALELPEQIVAYTKVAVAQNFAPPVGRVCLAHASDDNWYRAVCLREVDEQTSQLFFPDFGFKENVVRSRMLPISDRLMEIPFLANHCILHGFDEKEVEFNQKVAKMLPEHLIAFAEVNIVTVERKEAHFVIRIPSIEKAVEEARKIYESECNEKKDAEEKRRKREELLAQLAALDMN